MVAPSEAKSGVNSLSAVVLSDLPEITQQNLAQHVDELTDFVASDYEQLTSGPTPSTVGGYQRCT